MGYNTHYKLRVSDNFDEVAEFLTVKEDQYWEAKEVFEDYGESRKWYDHDEDMLSISKEFPDVLFTLEGDGAEPGDLWFSYYKNGKMKHCPAIITYEEFDESKLK